MKLMSVRGEEELLGKQHGRNFRTLYQAGKLENVKKKCED